MRSLTIILALAAMLTGCAKPVLYPVTEITQGQTPPGVFVSLPKAASGTSWWQVPNKGPDGETLLFQMPRGARPMDAGLSGAVPYNGAPAPGSYSNVCGWGQYFDPGSGLCKIVPSYGYGGYGGGYGYSPPIGFYIAVRGRF
jgi:hypothetical protein